MSSDKKQASFDFNGGINSQVSFEYQMMAFLKSVFNSKNNVYAGYEVHDDFLLIDTVENKYLVHQSKSSGLTKNAEPGIKYISFDDLIKYNFIILNFDKFMPDGLKDREKYEKQLIFDSNSDVKIMGGSAVGVIDYKDINSNKSFSVPKKLIKFIPDELIDKVKVLKSQSDMLSFLQNINEKNNIKILTAPRFLPSWQSEEVMKEIYNSSKIVKNIVDNSNYDITFAASQLATLKDGILKSSQELNFEKFKNTKNNLNCFLTRDQILNAFYRKINSDIFMFKNRWEESYKKGHNDVLSKYVYENGGYNEDKLNGWTKVTQSFSEYGDFTAELVSGEMTFILKKLYEVNYEHKSHDSLNIYRVNEEGQKMMIDILDKEYKRGNITIEYLIVMFLKGATHE